MADLVPDHVWYFSLALDLYFDSDVAHNSQFSSSSSLAYPGIGVLSRAAIFDLPVATAACGMWRIHLAEEVADQVIRLCRAVTLVQDFKKEVARQVAVYLSRWQKVGIPAWISFPLDAERFGKIHSDYRDRLIHSITGFVRDRDSVVRPARDIGPAVLWRDIRQLLD